MVPKYIVRRSGRLIDQTAQVQCTAAVYVYRWTAQYLGLGNYIMVMGYRSVVRKRALHRNSVVFTYDIELNEKTHLWQRRYL